MRTYVTLLTLLTMAALPLRAEETAAAHRACLIVNISGFKSDDGQVRVYLFNSKDGFPSKPAKALAVRKEKRSGLAHELLFGDLPYGTYAVAAHHDVNANDKMDSNWMHIPKEPTGASNGARGTFGPPSFKAAKFEVNADTVRMDVKVK